MTSYLFVSSFPQVLPLSYIFVSYFFISLILSLLPRAGRLPREVAEISLTEMEFLNSDGFIGKI